MDGWKLVKVWENIIKKGGNVGLASSKHGYEQRGGAGQSLDNAICAGKVKCIFVWIYLKIWQQCPAFRWSEPRISTEY